MATDRTLTVRGRTQMQPGEFLSPAAKVDGLLKFKIQVNVTNAAWDDPDFHCMLQIELCETPEFAAGTVDVHGAEIYGGARDKQGNLPSIEAYWDTPRNLHVRGRLTTNKVLSIGLNGFYTTEP